MTPIFDFHLVVSSLTTPSTIPTTTPSLVKTSLKRPVVTFSTRLRIHFQDDVNQICQNERASARAGRAARAEIIVSSN